MKKTLLLFLSVLVMSTFADSLVLVKNVTAQQRYPWNGLVDITVTIQGAAEDVANVGCSFAATNSATEVAIPVVHITRNGDDSGSCATWTRKFIWDAKADVGAVKIDDVALTVVLKPLGGVQLWENGPYWAECNVGASQPEECGYYFWWGDTVGYKRNASNDGWISVKDGTGFLFGSSNCPTYGKDNSSLQSAGYIDSTGNLIAAHDAATAHLGAPWRMLTDAEFSALISNCTTTWTTRNGVAGRLVTGKDAYASKSIFLPAAGYGSGSGLYGLGLCGYCWSSTPDSDYSNYAWFLYFDSSYFNRRSRSRYYGQSVRPVRGFADSSVATGGVATHLTLDFLTDAVTVTSVTAQQRYPWNGLVDITVTIQGTAEDVAKADCLFAAKNSATQAAIPVEHIKRNGSDSGSGTTWTRKFIWDAKADVGAVKIDDVALIVDAKIFGGVQLWENGPYWAECNVGANQPGECGYYFWWGDTVGYKRNANNDGWVSIKDGTGFSFSDGNCPTYRKDNSSLQSAGYIDSTGNLVAAHDAATAHLGAPWRMPTDAEFSALISNCTTTWTTRNGVAGRLVTGKDAYASKSIFLPAAGYGGDSYLTNLGSSGGGWSSTPYSGGSLYAWALGFNSGNFSRNYSNRGSGRSVRPVRGFAGVSGDIGVSGNSATTHLSLDTRTELPASVVPTVEGDEDATVTGDAETGFVIQPSEGKTAVEVTIPQGVDAAKVTIEVSPKVASVKPNGAKVKIVSGGADITEWLNIPGTTRGDDGGVVATQPGGVIDLTKATVKEEIVKEAMDIEKGAVIDLCGGPLGTTGPTITTAPTRIGLFYSFSEGRTLGGMERSASKTGDGKPWSPEIKVKGGNSAFYSIGVGKGE